MEYISEIHVRVNTPVYMHYAALQSATTMHIQQRSAPLSFLLALLRRRLSSGVVSRPGLGELIMDVVLGEDGVRTLS